MRLLLFLCVSPKAVRRGGLLTPPPCHSPPFSPFPKTGPLFPMGFLFMNIFHLKHSNDLNYYTVKKNQFYQTQDKNKSLNLNKLPARRQKNKYGLMGLWNLLSKVAFKLLHFRIITKISPDPSNTAFIFKNRVIIVVFHQHGDYYIFLLLNHVFL